MVTHGQLNNGVKITLKEFESEVGKKLKAYVLLKFNMKHLNLCRKLYRKGYSIDDTVSFIILNS